MPAGRPRKRDVAPNLLPPLQINTDTVAETINKAQASLNSGELPRGDAVTSGASKARTRPTRTPFGGLKLKLSAIPIPGFHLHWVNEAPGRLEEATIGGYEFVDEQEQLAPGQSRQANSDLGTRVRRLVGRGEDGNAQYAYLMKIPLDWYDQDQRELQAKVDAVDNMIRRAKMGNVENAYAPDAPAGAPPGASIKISNT